MVEGTAEAPDPEVSNLHQARAVEPHSKGDATSVVYGSAQRNASAAWDADHIQGCLCDEPGYIGDTQHNLTKWFGYDCSLHSCPTGDYQRTTNQSFEEQDIRCDATSGNGWEGGGELRGACIYATAQLVP